MKMKVCYNCCRIIFVDLFLAGWSFAVQEQAFIQRNFQIYNNQKLVGQALEIEEREGGQIHYTKDVRYFLGNHIHSDFRINPDFRAFQGVIRVEGETAIEMDEMRAVIDIKGQKKTVRFKSLAYPLSIVHLFVHDQLKKNQSIQKNFDVFFESTGELLALKISIKKTSDHFDIDYHFEKESALIKETFFPGINRYHLEFASLQYIDQTIPDSFPRASVSHLSNRVENPHRMDISQCQQIDFLIRSPVDVSIPGNEHQKIIEEKINKMGKWTRLKTVQEHVLKGTGDVNNNYVKSFSGVDDISKLARKIAGKKKSDADKMVSLLEWIRQSIRRVEVGPVEPAEVLLVKKGDCQGISNLFIAMVAAFGKPVRASVGIVIDKKGHDFFFNYHQWAEVNDGEKWISYDPMVGMEGIGPNYVKLFNIEKQFDIIKLFKIMEQLQIQIEGCGE